MMPDAHDDPATYELVAHVDALTHRVEQMVREQQQLRRAYRALATAAAVVCVAWEEGQLDRVHILALSTAIAAAGEAQP